MEAPKAEALPGHAVTLLLSYLSRLDEPLPPHLISTPLRQRHHFLGLGSVLDTAQEAAAYLSWPSSSGSEDEALRVVDLLGALPSAENFDPLVAYPTKYSYDGESVYAHAQIPVSTPDNNDSAGLRLVFRWEAKDGDGVIEGHNGSATNVDNWKYHDAKPMPFPPNSYDSPQEASRTEFSAPPISSPSAVHQPSGFVPNPYHEPSNAEDEDDSYWNAYGRSNSDDENENPYSSSNANTHKETDEDAYWAQYASVHGTADSTRPSPPPQKHRRLHDPSEPISIHHSTESSTNFDSYERHDIHAPDARRPGVHDSYDVEHIEHLNQFSNAREGRDGSPVKGAPCPAALTRRLHDISPRPSHSPSPAPSEPDAVSTKLENADSSESSESSDGRTLTPTGNSDAKHEKDLLPLASPIDAGLHEAIKGVYRLWAATRKPQVPDEGALGQKDEFMKVVQDALNEI